MTSFDHGPKDAEHQRYIVLHDTEGEGAPESVVSWWASNGNLVAAHFVVGKDGHIVQCVPLDGSRTMRAMATRATTRPLASRRTGVTTWPAQRRLGPTLPTTA